MVYSFKVRYHNDDFLIDVVECSFAEVHKRINSVIGNISEPYILRVFDGESYVRFGEFELFNIAHSALSRTKLLLEPATSANPQNAATSASPQNAATSASPQNAAALAVHEGVTCDGCGANPIVGHRYKCTVCRNYDLCHRCFSAGTIHAEHNMVVFRAPQPAFPLHHGGHHGFFNRRGAHCWRKWFDHAPSAHPCGNAGNHAHPCGSAAASANPNGSAAASANPSGSAAAHANHGGSGGNHANHCGSAGNHANHGAFAAPQEQYLARFVKDVTLFDGTVVPPQTALTKVWRVRNSGAVPWPPSTKLVFVGGDYFARDPNAASTRCSGTSASGEASAAAGECSRTVEVAVGAVAASEEVDVALDIVTPRETGRFVGYWRLSGGDCGRFGHRMWCEIRVEEEETELSQVIDNAESANPEAAEAPTVAAPSAIASENTAVPANPAASENTAIPANPEQSSAAAPEENSATSANQEAGEDFELVSGPFADAIALLREMGFAENDENLARLCALKNGEIKDIIDHLLNH